MFLFSHIVCSMYWWYLSVQNITSIFSRIYCPCPYCNVGSGTGPDGNSGRGVGGDRGKPCMYPPVRGCGGPEGGGAECGDPASCGRRCQRTRWVRVSLTMCEYMYEYELGSSGIIELRYVWCYLINRMLYSQYLYAQFFFYKTFQLIHVQYQTRLISVFLLNFLYVCAVQTLIAIRRQPAGNGSRWNYSYNSSNRPQSTQMIRMLSLVVILIVVKPGGVRHWEGRSPSD